MANPSKDVAIVLVSAERKIRGMYKPEKTAHDLFDRVYTKEEININSQTVVSQLLSLCNGYSRLRESIESFVLCDLMSLSDDEKYAIDFQELNVGVAEAKCPHTVARIILQELIDNSGPLISDYEAAARLGVTTDSLSLLLDKGHLKQEVYAGIFSEIDRRFWSHRLDKMMEEVFKVRSTGLPASKRTELLSSHFGEALWPAISPWTSDSAGLIAIACASCRRGTEIKHSLAAYERRLPKFSNRRRVCWDCIQKDAHIDRGIVIDDSDAELVHAVHKMDRPKA